MMQPPETAEAPPAEPTTKPRSGDEAALDMAIPSAHARAAISDFTAQRDTALSTLDLEWARNVWPDAPNDEALLVSMHQARYELQTIVPFLRHESRKRLEELKVTRMFGEPWPPDGQLPVEPPPEPVVDPASLPNSGKLPASEILARDLARKYLETTVTDPAQLLAVREEAREHLKKWCREKCETCAGAGSLPILVDDEGKPLPPDQQKPIPAPSKEKNAKGQPKQEPGPKRVQKVCEGCGGLGHYNRTTNTRDEDRVTGQLLGARARALAHGIVEGLFPKMPPPMIRQPGESSTPLSTPGPVPNR